MSVIYHILGADVPHHNQTLLNFFQNTLLPQLPDQQHVFYVIATCEPNYPSLDVRWFVDKKSLVHATLLAAKLDKQARFILHGQYNLWVWLALFCGKLPACRVIWHVWGADLYETANGWKAKLFYRFRRHIQKKLSQVWATQGDLNHFWRHIRSKSTQDSLLYFPTKLEVLPGLQAREGELHRPLTVLLGNSGDRSNRHIQALNSLHKQLGSDLQLIIPMGYPENNDVYIQQVENHAKRLFSAEKVQILWEKLDFDTYLAQLNRCDFGYFNFERQQGIGTLCLLLQQGIPFALNPSNPFIDDLRLNHVPFLYANEVSLAKISDTRLSLRHLTLAELGFFPEKYTQQWLSLLRAM